MSGSAVAGIDPIIPIVPCIHMVGVAVVFVIVAIVISSRSAGAGFMGNSGVGVGGDRNRVCT